jgi:eukaryotic-like serine/threonine-protein kinase
MAMLRPGQTLHCLSSGLACHVESLLDEGGQGEVYAVSINGRRFALKWYNDRVLRLDLRLRSRLQVAIDRGAPSAKFLWPFELVTLPDGSRLGYLMRLRRESMQKLHDLLSGELKPSFRVLATMCCLLSDALLALHSKGFAYLDLNAGNAFFDFLTGDIEICDNDNVDVDGEPSVMAGVWEYQAPEVVLRRAGPSRATDLHSLAVMLFRILHLGHPLLGKRVLEHPNLTDLASVRRLYGTEARFVFDPADDSNRPLPELHGPVIGHWSVYPQFLRDLLTKAFTEGLYDPIHGRVQETVWRQAMSRLRDSVQSCSHCGYENFYDAARIAAKQTSFACWSCGASLSSTPPRIGIRRGTVRPEKAPPYIVVLDPGAQLFPHHTSGSHYDFGKATAEVVGGTPELLNLCECDWTVQHHGSSVRVAPGQLVSMVAGLRIQFPQTEGEVKM